MKQLCILKPPLTKKPFYLKSRGQEENNPSFNAMEKPISRTDLVETCSDAVVTCYVVLCLL